ncbi:MAG: chemotaxis protein CheW [Oleiphilus sp.]|nr:MAG: chemotaxis protein CheW [Oleiphilus sp.]
MSEVLEIISSFYLPICAGKLLLPNVSVAEVVEYQKPETAEGPETLLGMVRWRGIQVPLISFELANGQSFSISKTSRIAVINSVGEHSERHPFFSIVTQGIPRLVKITEDSIEPSDEKPGPAEAAKVRIDGEEASIPDLAYLESLISDRV